MSVAASVVSTERLACTRDASDEYMRASSLARDDVTRADSSNHDALTSYWSSHDTFNIKAPPAICVHSLPIATHRARAVLRQAISAHACQLAAATHAIFIVRL